jgi:hypothetical protein
MKWLLVGDGAGFSHSTSLSENKEGLAVRVVLTRVCIVALLKSIMFALVSLTLYTQMIFALNSEGFAGPWLGSNLHQGILLRWKSSVQNYDNWTALEGRADTKFRRQVAVAQSV